MQRAESSAGWRHARVAWWLAGTLAVPACLAAPEQTEFLHRAPITVQRIAPFIEVPLTPATYARSLSPGLADLRVVDAQGERVPFALMAPSPGQPLQTRSRRPARLFALPVRPVGSASGPAAFELDLDQGRLSLRQGGAPVQAAGRSPGWLIDLGESAAGDPAPAFIELAWDGAAEFSAGYRLETSDDLRQWRAAEGGQLMSLRAPAGPLTQPLVALPTPTGRYVKLEWLAADEAPPLAGAQAVSLQARLHGAGALEGLQADAVPEPSTAGGAGRAVVFDLQAPLPLADVSLTWGSGTHVVPALVQGRERTEQPWVDLARAVFYRLEREGAVSVSPPLSLQATVRYLRVVPDERAGSLATQGTVLHAHAALGRLVFAAQGTPPFGLLAGAPGAAPGALPLQGLVPALQEERARFGAGRVGEWASSAPAVARAEAERKRAAWRPALLWAALLSAVAVLAAMVWRLARSRPAG